MRTAYLGNTWNQKARLEEDEPRRRHDVLDDVQLGKVVSCIHVDVTVTGLPEHCYRPCPPFRKMVVVALQQDKPRC